MNFEFQWDMSFKVPVRLFHLFFASVSRVVSSLLLFCPLLIDVSRAPPSCLFHLDSYRFFPCPLFHFL